MVTDPKPDVHGSQLQLDNWISSLLETENPGYSRQVRPPCHPVTPSAYPPAPVKKAYRLTCRHAWQRGARPRRRAIGHGMVAAGHAGGVVVYALLFTN
jgi:hypothetical protein